MAEVTVDPETGIVTVERVWVAHDCGRAINPLMVEGQIEGSVYMGYAEALMEAQVFDERGLHTGPNLLDYRIPTSVETPDIIARIVETIDPGGPYGAKGRARAPASSDSSDCQCHLTQWGFGCAIPFTPTGCWRL